MLLTFLGFGNKKKKDFCVRNFADSLVINEIEKKLHNTNQQYARIENTMKSFFATIHTKKGAEKNDEKKKNCAEYDPSMGIRFCLLRPS